MDVERERLTARQREVLACVVRHFAETGGPPNLREIMAAMGFASPHGVWQHLRALHRKRWLLFVPGRKRGIEIPEVSAATKAAAAEYLELLAAVPTK